MLASPAPWAVFATKFRNLMAESDEEATIADLEEAA
jgi:hypothetical protein